MYPSVACLHVSLCSLFTCIPLYPVYMYPFFWIVLYCCNRLSPFILLFSQYSSIFLYPLGIFVLTIYVSLCIYIFIVPLSLYPSYIPVFLLHPCIPPNFWFPPAFLYSSVTVYPQYPSCISLSVIHPCIPPTFLYPILHFCIPLVSLLYPYIQSFIPVLLYLLVPPYPSCFPVSNPSSLYSSVYLYPPVSLCITTVSLYFSCFPVSNPSSLYSSVYLYPPVSLMYPCIQSFIPILICLLVPLVPLIYPYI